MGLIHGHKVGRRASAPDSDGKMNKRPLTNFLFPVFDILVTARTAQLSHTLRGPRKQFGDGGRRLVTEAVRGRPLPEQSGARAPWDLLACSGREKPGAGPSCANGTASPHLTAA